MQERYRTLIVDDERLARAGLKAMLREFPELEIVGEASDGLSAAKAIRTLSPVLMFLDIQMPGLDGLRLAEVLPAAQRPAVIFVTAHSDYALEAFGVQALDYLLKPLSRTRLRDAVRRALGVLRAGTANGLEVRRLPARGTDGMQFVDPADIRWIEVQGNQTRIEIGGHWLELRMTLRKAVQHLDPSSFVRISRSVLVNMRHVERVRAGSNRRYDVTIGGVALHSSRRCGALIRAAMRRTPHV